jgi:hypothetical protein
MKDFHCCASCEHFRAVKRDGGMRYDCTRLGYETNPQYQFNCWSPKEHIKKLIENEKRN